jgi:hypothetical protein
MKLLAALLAIAGAAQARLDSPPPRAPVTPHAKESGYDLRVGLFGGYFSGDGVRRDSGGVALLDLAFTPVLLQEAFRLEAPVHLERLQTLGATLSETKGAAGAAFDWRPVKAFHVGPEAGIAFALRSGWPDLYQRQADGTMPPTDRYSFYSLHAGAAASASASRLNHFKFRYRYSTISYGRDPAFQPDIDPMHLTPVDHRTHDFLAQWKLGTNRLGSTLRIEYQRRLDQVLLARNAYTGTTSGYRNPLQRLNLLEPSIEGEARGLLGGMLGLSAGYGFLIQNDPFQGYYSYTGHRARVQVEAALTEPLHAHLRAEALLLTYGPESTSSQRLSSGSRRFDRRFSVDATASYQLAKSLFAVVDARWLNRDTNYPDYVPGILPATRFYDIQWSYTNVQVLVGIQYGPFQ